MERQKSNLKIIRENVGVTQDELAEATGIAKRTIRNMESEMGANPSVATVKRLLQYFEISFEELYSDF